MSLVKTDALQGKTSAGDITVTSEGGAATQSLQQGLAKAWCNLNGTGTIAQRDSLNHSSTTDNTTGTYTFSLVSSMGNTNYISPTNCDRIIDTRNGTEGVQYLNIATGSYKIECVNSVPNLSDEELVNTQTLGGLA
tara:strand:- start:175 stop:582 length:408 start_codon:yes stop_codon:yes gene_type:complete